MINSLFQIAPDINTKKVAIYGTDNSALLMFSVLLQNEVYVSCFITKDDAKTQRRIMNKPIVLIDSIQEQKDAYIIVMCGQAALSDAEKLDMEGYNVFFDFNKTSYDGDSIMIGDEEVAKDGKRC